VTSNKVQEKARRLWREKAITLDYYDGRRVSARVIGDHGSYRVRIWKDGRTDPTPLCECQANVLWCSHSQAVYKLWRWQVRPWWMRAWWRFYTWLARIFLRKEVEVD
jgi:hypothetical protein